MSPRNWIRAAVVVLACALIVYGVVGIITGRDADAVPRTVSSTADDDAVAGASVGPASVRSR